VASCGTSIGSKGMILAAKTMSLAGYDLLTQPNLLVKARQEFDAARNGQQYVTPLPEGVLPQ
jgi:aminobenzoyl-glutamate utilization protein B